MTELRLLGTLDLRDPSDGEECTSILTRPKRLALLAYLALARPDGFCQRDTLLGIFWPELSQRRARRALSQALYVLRKGLGDGVVVVRGQDEAGIDRSRLWCDAEAFEAALDAEEHETALELYGGDLLNGFSLPGCAEFEHWLTKERERLRSRAVEAARALTREGGATGDKAAAVRWLRRAIVWEPYDEGLVRRLMECLAALGDRAGALREYEALEERLVSDLGLESSEETRRVAEEIRRAPAASKSGDPDRRPSAEGIRRAGVGSGARRRKPAGEFARLAHPVLRAAASLVFLLGVVGFLYIRLRDRPPALDSNRVLIAGFENRTGQDELDPLGPMATDWLLQELTGTGLVRVVLGQEGDGPGSSASAISRAVNLGARYAIVGSYDRTRDSIAFQVQILDAESKEARVGIEGIKGDVGDLPSLVKRLRQRSVAALATLLDDRLGARVSHGASLPPTVEAFRHYAEGMERLLDDREPHRAAEAFHRAAAADTTFTAPLIWAIAAHRNVGFHPDPSRRDPGQIQLADSLVRYLEHRRDRLPPWDAAALDYKVADLRQDWKAAYSAMGRIVDMSPDPSWVRTLVALAGRANDPYAKLEILDGLDPDRGWVREWPGYWTHRMHALHRLRRYDEEYRTLKAFRRRYPVETLGSAPKSASDVIHEIRVLAASGRIDELDHLLDEVLAAPPDKPARLWSGLREIEVHGHREIARRARVRLAEAITDRPRVQWDYYWRWTWSMALLEEGRLQEARTEIEGLLEEAPRLSYRSIQRTIVHLGDLGRIAIALGDSAEARRYDLELATLDLEPYERLLSSVVALQRARIQAQLGNRKRAIALIREALEKGHEFGTYHFEGLNVGLEPLMGDPAYEELVRPRRAWARR